MVGFPPTTVVVNLSATVDVVEAQGQMNHDLGAILSFIYPKPSRPAGPCTPRAVPNLLIDAGARGKKISLVPGPRVSILPAKACTR